MMNLFLFFCHRYFILWLCAGCLLFELGCDSTRSVPEGLYVTPGIRNLGVVVDTNEITGNFKIVNTSDKIVNIRSVKLSCGCSNIHLSKEEILPNGFIDVELTVNVEGKYGPSVFEALVFTDYDDTPIIQLHLNANIATRKLDGTVLLNLGSAFAGDQINQTFTILPGKVASVSVSNIQYSSSFSSQPLFEILATPSREGQNVELGVVGVAPSQNGEFSIELSLRGEESDWGEASILLQGIIQPKIVVPATISMGFIEPKQSNENVVEIINMESLLSKRSIDRMIVTNPVPEILTIQLINPARPQLEFSLRHPGTTGTFSQTVEMEFVFSDGEKNHLSTSIIARFL